MHPNACYQYLFLPGLLDALSAGIKRALASGLGRQVLLSLLIGSLLLKEGLVLVIELLLLLLGGLEGLGFAAVSSLTAHDAFW